LVASSVAETPVTQGIEIDQPPPCYWAVTIARLMNVVVRILDIVCEYIVEMEKFSNGESEDENTI